MRAVSLRAPRELEIVEAPAPSPGRGEVLVQVRACGLCGSDQNAWRGVPGVEYPLPTGAPGHETWGEVVEIGDGVQTLTPGQRVTGLMSNGLAELGVAREEDLLALSADAPLLLGEPLACAMNVVRRAGLQNDQRVAVVGFGYLAALMVQLFPAGVEWIALARRAESRELARRLGAANVYDFASVPAELWDGVDVVIEAAGAQQTLDYATWLTAYRGRLVVAGYHADGPRMVNMQSWNWKGIDVINAHERQPSVYVEALREASALLSARRIDLDALHTHRYSLDAAARAFQAAEEHPAGFVKALVCP